MIDPKPCPFCGYTKITIENVYPTEFAKGYFCVKCEKCGAKMVDFYKAHNIEEVVRAWNKRVYEQ